MPWGVPVSSGPAVGGPKRLAWRDAPWVKTVLHLSSLFVSPPSLVTQLVKNLPTVQSDRVLTSGQGDPLEKGMATHSSILAWRVPWTEEPSRLQRSPWGRTKSDMTEQ